MKTEPALVSYIIVGASAIDYMLTSNLGSFTVVFGDFFARTLAIAGLVVGPYFGLAALIAKENSVWVETDRMLHEHLSIAVAGGGFLLFFPVIYSDAGFTLIPIYVLLVFLATLVSVMARKTGKVSVVPET